MKRFFLLVYWSTAAASPPIGGEAGARPPVGWRPGAETGAFLAPHMFATLSLIKCMGAAERFIEIWKNWKMKQTSFPYFGVKLSCVCLMSAYRKKIA